MSIKLTVVCMIKMIPNGSTAKKKGWLQYGFIFRMVKTLRKLFEFWGIRADKRFANG